MKSFGKFVRANLKKQGKSQKTLADELGVSPAYISQICSGKKNPPDLGRRKSRAQLRAWALGLGASEDEVLELIRYELHRIPPKPAPRYRSMRQLLIRRLDIPDRTLVDEMGGMELHPAESRAVRMMVQIYVALTEDQHETRAYGATRFRDFCSSAATDREFVEGPLTRFFQEQAFSWIWDSERNDIRLRTESTEILEGMKRVGTLLRGAGASGSHATIPVVGHVSAGVGFEYTDGGYCAGEGFEQVPLPPGVDLDQAQELYCVRVQGDSLREFFSDGALLFIKPESWEEIRDGDLVIFKDRGHGRAFVKKVEFAGENLILKSMNQMYKNIVMGKLDLMLLERVMAIVL